jgi:hypothetical protein
MPRRVFSLTLVTLMLSGAALIDAKADEYTLCNPSPAGQFDYSHQVLQLSDGTRRRTDGMVRSRMFRGTAELLIVLDVSDGNTETVVQGFCGPWLDITTRVETTGRLKEGPVIHRHTPNPLVVGPTARTSNTPYAVVQFRLEAGAGNSGVIRLKRPGPLGVGEHETVFRYQIVPNIRLRNPALLPSYFPAQPGAVHVLSLGGQGLGHVRGVNPNPPRDLPLESVRIRGRTASSLDLELRFRRPGTINAEDLFHRFLQVPPQTRIVFPGGRMVDGYPGGGGRQADALSDFVVAHDPGRPPATGSRIPTVPGRMLVEGVAVEAQGPGGGSVAFRPGGGVAAGGAAGVGAAAQPNLLPQRMPPLGQLVRVIGTGRNNTREVSAFFCTLVPQDRVAVVDVPPLVWGVSVVNANVDQPVRAELRSGATVIASFDTTPPLRANADAQTRSNYPNRPTRIRVANVVADLVEDYGRRGCFLDRALSANDSLGRVDAPNLSIVVDPGNRVDEGPSGEQDNVLVIN